MDLKLLITAAEITDLTVVEVSVDDHKLEKAAWKAQRQYLRPLLGAALFGALLAFAQPATPDTEDVLAALANEVKPMLAQWSIYEGWPTLQGHITNAGIQFKSSREGSTRADKEVVDDMRADFLDTATFETAELRAWLTAHKSDYPTWAPEGIIQATDDMPVGGFQLS